MRYYSLFFLIPICLLFAGCNKQTGHNANESSEFYTIDFEQGFDTEQQMLISEIADSVEYIELKTPDDIIITRIWDIKQVDDYLVVRASLYAYLFHKNGQFIKRIGNVGQGPGEYMAASKVEIDFKKKEIIIADAYPKLLFYDLNGDFLRSKQLEGDVYDIGLSDSILWVGQMIYSAQQKDLAVAISSTGEGDTLAHLPNASYNAINTGNTGFIGSPLTKMFYHKADLLYFKGNDSNDTIWSLSGANAKPHAFIDMGKYKMPVEFEPWNISIDTYIKNCGRYWSVSSLVEDNRYFFLLAQNRISDKENLILDYIVYDKEQKTSFTAKDENGMGMTDDMLGGPPVWPRWISDDYYMNAVESYELLDKIETGEYTPSGPLKELLSGIDEFANPLVVLCHRKK